jgi:hypothetical protein
LCRSGYRNKLAGWRRGGRGWDRGREKYVAADATVAFLDVLVAFIEWTFGLQCHGYVATVAGAGVYLRILDLGGGFRALEGMWGVCGFESFAVVYVRFIRPDVVEVAEGSCLLLLV